MAEKRVTATAKRFRPPAQGCRCGYPGIGRKNDHSTAPRLRQFSLDCPPIITGGMEDHVHLLARFGRTITQAEWVKELKRLSNLWLKKEYSLTNFEWQGGYADFSVSQSNLEQVKRYIVTQEEHHKTRSFQDEVRELLQRHRMEWNERYIWD